MFTVIVLIAGCGGGSQDLKLHSVTGVVTLDGNPVANASVSFQPKTTPSTEKLATGRTDSNGKFALQTDGRRGASAGIYLVSVFAQQEPAGGPAPVLAPMGSPSASANAGKAPTEAPKLLVPEKYTKPDQSGLEFDVLPKSNHIEIKLISNSGK